MALLKQIFTWWNSQTLGTRLHTWFNGIFVGQDSSGNMYYESTNSQRRWVIFSDHLDASTVSAEWHGWLHHTVSYTPTTNKPIRQKWEKPHEKNNTGTRTSYHPLGTNRLKLDIRTDYEAWNPEND
jgi:NADH:ubiquinone oxidoreductase subunit